MMYPLTGRSTGLTALHEVPDRSLEVSPKPSFALAQFEFAALDRRRIPDRTNLCGHWQPPSGSRRRFRKCPDSHQRK